MGNTESSISRSKRDIPPAHYMMKIQSYSLLAGAGVKYDSGLFESGGHKWKLSLYPKGKENNNYISLYLAIEETDTYPDGWELFANFRFFIYDQMRDNYLTILDTNATANRFSEMKKEWGISELISFEIFNNPRHGYLVDDGCVFGAEVCILNHSHRWESIYIVKEPVNDSYFWNLEKFSSLQSSRCYESQVFTIGERKWTLRVYPKGNGSGAGTWLSVFLCLVDGSAILPIFAHYKLRILARNKRQEHTVEFWFRASPGNVWGMPQFMELKDLKEFICNDTLTVEVQFLKLSAMKVIPQGK